MKTIICASIALALLSFSVPALAIPGDSGTPAAKPAPSPKALKCKRGETAKRIKKKWTCVKLKADVLPDRDLYQAARRLASTGDYEWALDHLRIIRDQQDADVLSYTGYANRKAGRLETGIAYYQKALANNPGHVQAREYLGEAYVLAGLRPLAEMQLQEIELRCGTTCEAYTTLDAFMATEGNNRLKTDIIAP